MMRNVCDSFFFGDGVFSLFVTNCIKFVMIIQCELQCENCILFHGNALTDKSKMFKKPGKRFDNFSCWAFANTGGRRYEYILFDSMFNSHDDKSKSSLFLIPQSRQWNANPKRHWHQTRSPGCRFSFEKNASGAGIGRACHCTRRGWRSINRLPGIGLAGYVGLFYNKTVLQIDRLSRDRGANQKHAGLPERDRDSRYCRGGSAQHESIARDYEIASAYWRNGIGLVSNRDGKRCEQKNGRSTDNNAIGSS